MNKNSRAIFFVSALGYFVDVFDIVLFSIVRISSLKDLGLPDSELFSTGMTILNCQMAGMILGGLAWGVIGDRIGRKSALFGSIAIYSIASIANAFVWDTTTYAVLRLIAGIGLAGELGAGITMVSESTDRKKRGLSTTLVASMGFAGAAAAAAISGSISWRWAYGIGGVLGLGLLALRISTLESGMFLRAKTAQKKVSFQNLFSTWPSIRKYIGAVLAGIPCLYSPAVIMTFAPEIARSLNVSGEVRAERAILFSYTACLFGDLASGLISQLAKNRRLVLFGFIVGQGIAIFSMLTATQISPSIFYLECAMIGFFTGFWALVVTMAAEQFGTNIRATVATTVPNFARGSVVFISPVVAILKDQMPLSRAVLIVGAAVIGAALAGSLAMEESFNKDLDYLE